MLLPQTSRRRSNPYLCSILNSRKSLFIADEILVLLQNSPQHDPLFLLFLNVYLPFLPSVSSLSTPFFCDPISIKFTGLGNTCCLHKSRGPLSRIRVVQAWALILTAVLDSAAFLFLDSYFTINCQRPMTSSHAR